MRIAMLKLIFDRLGDCLMVVMEKAVKATANALPQLEVVDTVPENT